ncbi:hypothetical protein JZ751_027478 [Albula glossodonta]|uniref:AB hydrolase-1 domain-containing protein n=1 Tax=Albula glossodonta TaxID=121402 RepID=A0A8T2NN55_9TELE|nr:hypothetical protein JZ751_027478 [Albula glossodonta]
MTSPTLSFLLFPTRLSLWLLSLLYWAAVYGTAAITACIVLLRIAWRGLRNPRGTFRWKVRDSPPACLRDPALGLHGYLRCRSSGLRLHFVSKGESRRPLMLFLHGFPENWYSWRYQLKEFSVQYHTVALDLRGCGDSAAPYSLEDYMLEKLLDDVRDTINGLGYTSCVLVGHDWGGMLAWHFALERPDMVQRLVIMNAPHPASWLGNTAALLKPHPHPQYLVRSLLCGGRMGIRNRARRLTEAELEGYLYYLSRPGGLTAPLNYFRALLSNSLYRHQDVGVSCMLIWGEADSILVEGMSGGARPYARGSEMVHRIPDCSHWVQQDQPETVNKLLWDFLLEREPPQF